MSFNKIILEIKRFLRGFKLKSAHPKMESETLFEKEQLAVVITPVFNNETVFKILHGHVKNLPSRKVL